jgi:hypothetical protein
MMIRINRPDDKASVLVNGALVQSVEIIQQLDSATADAKFSLVLVGSGNRSWIVAGDKTTAQLGDLFALREQIWQAIVNNQPTLVLIGTNLPAV